MSSLISLSAIILNRGALTLIPVHSVSELVDRWWDLEAHQKHGLLSLQTDVLGPSHKPGKILRGLDRATNSIAAGVLLEQST